MPVDGSSTDLGGGESPVDKSHSSASLPTGGPRPRGPDHHEDGPRADPSLIPLVLPADPGASSRVVVLAQWVEPTTTGSQIPLVELAEPAELSPSMPRLPHPGFWWSAFWCVVYSLLVGGIVVAVQIIAVIVQITVSPNPRELAQDLRSGGFQQSSEFKRIEVQAVQPAVAAGQMAGALFVLILIRAIVGRNWQRGIALRAPGGIHLVLVLAMLPGLVVVCSGVLVLFKSILPDIIQIHYQEQIVGLITEWPPWFNVLVIGLGAAVGEELFCRGFLGRGLVGRYGFVKGILLTSMFFGILHLDPPHVLATFVMGMVLHFVYLMTRSLWMPMLLHFLNNSLAGLEKYLPLGHTGGNADEMTGAVYAAGVILTLAVGWALYRSRARLVPAEVEGRVAWHQPFPGVELPPSGAGIWVACPWPGWPAAGLVVLAVAGFVWTNYLL